MGRTVRRQAGHPTRVISTTMSQGVWHPEFLEHSEPAQVLPIRKCPVMSQSPGAWKISFPRNNLEAACHNVWVILSFTGARWLLSRENICVNRLLVVNDMKVMATFITYRLHLSTETSAPIKSAPCQFLPRPWMVARNSSRISQHNRSVRLVHTQVVG
jgi:hypothetical protein